MGFDKEVVKNAARGRWREIASQLFHITDDYLTVSHGACPKCGGGPAADRWRIYDDFDETGGAICNKCGREMGDGLKLGEWFLGKSFPEVVDLVGNHLGLDAPRKKSKSKEPKELGLELIPWKPRLFDTWAGTKKPITEEAVRLAGGQFAKFLRYTVIAIPFRGRDGSINGWAMYNATGGTIEYRPNAESPVQHLKVRNLGCKQESGWAGRFLPGVETVKAEGVSDMLAILSCNPEASVVTNPFGATENPCGKFNAWMLETFRDQTVFTIHDIDEAGQEGATYVGEHRRAGWAPAIARVARESRNVILPLAGDQKDIRDFLNSRIDSGATPREAWDQVMAIARQGQVFENDGVEVNSGASEEPSDESIPEIPIEGPDDPHRLARMNLQKYEEICGGMIDCRYRLGSWRGEWWKWKNNRWVHVPLTDLKNELTESIKDEFNRLWREEYAEWLQDEDRAEKKPPVVRQVKTPLLQYVINAMSSEARINSNVELHSWIDKRSESRYISMRNGIFDINAYLQDKDEVLVEHSPNWFSTTCLDYEFNVEADCPRWKEYVEFVMDSDYERAKTLQEFMGYLLYPSTEYQKFLALEGQGGNGKSVFFAAIEAVIGRDNISNVPLQRFHGQFDLFQTLGKMVNICSDVAELDSVAEGVLKEYTGGDSMSFDRKNKDPITARPTAKLIMSWNNRPTFRDRSDAIWRRMILVPFNRQIPESKRNPEMVNPAWWIKSGEVPGILNWCLEGLSRLIENHKFSVSEKSLAAIESYKDESNVVRRFLLDTVMYDSEGCLVAKDLYKDYVDYCAVNGHKNPKNNNLFVSEITRLFPGVEYRRRQVAGLRDYHFLGLRRKMNEDYEREEGESGSIW